MRKILAALLFAALSSTASAQISNTLTVAQGVSGCIATNSCAVVVQRVTKLVYPSGCTVSGTSGEADVDCSGTGVPSTRLINTTSPLAGGGALSSDLTLTCTTCALTTGWAIPSAFATTTNTAAAETAGFASTWTTGAGGDSAGAATGGTGGLMTLMGGVGGVGSGVRAGGVGGAHVMRAGAGGAGSASASGGAGGTITIRGGTGGVEAGNAAGGGGNASFLAGTGGASVGTAAGATGGAANLTGGTGGAGSGAQNPGAGGNIAITAGAAGSGGSGNSNGGSFSVVGGLKQGTGTNGTINIGASQTSAVGIGAAGILVTITGQAQNNVGAVLTISSNILAPTANIHHVGAGLIKTITPAVAPTAGMVIHLVPDAAFTYDATGNVTVPAGGGTATINRTMDFTWDGTKWNPSY